MNGFFGITLTFLRPLCIQEMRGSHFALQNLDNKEQEASDNERLGRNEQDAGDKEEEERNELLSLNEKEAKERHESSDNLASLFGLFNSIVGIGTVAVPAISGSLVDALRSIKVTFVFHAFGYLFGFAALAIAIHLSRHEKAIIKENSGDCG